MQIMRGTQDENDGGDWWDGNSLAVCANLVQELLLIKHRIGIAFDIGRDNAVSTHKQIFDKMNEEWSGDSYWPVQLIKKCRQIFEHYILKHFRCIFDPSQILGIINYNQK